MEAPQRKAALTIASLVMVGALLSIWLRFRPPPPLKFDLGPIIAMQTGLGEAVAEETAQVVSNHGPIVLVTNFDHSRGRIDYCWDAFQRKLKKHTAIRVVATEVVPYDPLKNGPSVGCPRATFQTLLERHAQADAIVFLIALPQWPGDSVIPPHLSARIIALDLQSMGMMGESMRRRYTGYFASGILSALILPKYSTEPASTSPMNPTTPREWFDRFYSVYTAQNYDTLPESIGAAPN